MAKTILGLFCIMLVTGCGIFLSPGPDGTDGVPDDDGSGGSTLSIPRAYWGRWLRMDTQESWYIASNGVMTDGIPMDISAATDSGFTVSSGESLAASGTDTNVLQVSEPGGGSYLLFRRSGASSTFTAQVVSMGEPPARNLYSSARALGSGSSLIGVKAVLQNLTNPQDVQEVVSGADGNFAPQNTIPGDSYGLAVNYVPIDVTNATGLTVANAPQGLVLTPEYEGQNLGILTLTDGEDNFKVEIIDEASYFAEDGEVAPGGNLGFRYPDIEYPFIIRVSNVGKTGMADIISPNFRLEADPGVTILTGQTQGILNSIEPGMHRDIPITLKSSALEEEWEFRGLTVTITDKITDPNNDRTWADRVEVLFWNRTIVFNIAANGPINGVILSPENKAYRFSGGQEYEITLPWRQKDYLVAFSGATAETECAYQLGVNVPGGLSAPFTPPVAIAADLQEPNNTESSAMPVNATITAWLHKGDYDFYRVKGSTDVTVFLPVQYSISLTAMTLNTAYSPPREEADSYGKLAIAQATTFRATLSHPSDFYEWCVDGNTVVSGFLDFSTVVPELTIPAYGFLWGAHEVSLFVRKDASLFEETLAFTPK